MAAEHWQGVVTRELERLEAEVTKLRTAGWEEKRRLLSSCTRQLKSLDDSRKNLDRAVRLIRDPERKLQEKQALGGINKRMENLDFELKRAELDLKHRPTSLDTEEKAVDDDEMMRSINRVQDDTAESLTRTQQQLGQTLEVANRTRLHVMEQGEQLDDVHDTARKMRGQLSRADNIVSAFGKQISHDRITQGLVVLNLLVLVAIGLTIGLKWRVAKGFFT